MQVGCEVLLCKTDEVDVLSSVLGAVQANCQFSECRSCGYNLEKRQNGTLKPSFQNINPLTSTLSTSVHAMPQNPSAFPTCSFHLEIHALRINHLIAPPYQSYPPHLVRIRHAPKSQSTRRRQITRVRILTFRVPHRPRWGCKRLQTQAWSVEDVEGVRGG